MNLKYRHALVRNTERRQAELKADYRRFAKARRAERIKEFKAVVKSPFFILAVVFVFFLIKGISA